MMGRKSRKTSPKSRSVEPLSVIGCWVAQNNEIIAESQLNDREANKYQQIHSEFVAVFFQQIIGPAKPAKSEQSGSSFTIIYVKKRQYLFHIIYDDNLTFIALSITSAQVALDEIFDLLYSIKSAFLYEDANSFSSTLNELHMTYERRITGEASPTPSQGYDASNIIGDQVAPSKLPKSRTLSPDIAPPSYRGRVHSGKRTDYDSVEEKGDIFMLKKGFMTKQGSKFKTWKLRYFELWSNGKLNYFDNELKFKKRGCLNICDAVLSCDLYSRDMSNGSEFGFQLATANRTWLFLLDNQIDRDDWFMIIQTITFTKIAINHKMKNIKKWLSKLDMKWDSEFKHVSFDIDDPYHDQCNIFQLQFDLKAAVDVCHKSKKELSYFRGSDCYCALYNRVEILTENMEGAMFTIDAIIQSRDSKKTTSNKKKRSNSKHKKPSSSIAIENRVILRSTLKVRLPSNKLFSRAASMNKQYQKLEVVVQQKFLKVVVPSQHAPLLWLFDEIVKIDEMRPISAPKKKAKKMGKVEFTVTVGHREGKQLQFVFDDEENSGLWLAALRTLYEQTHCTKHKAMTINANVPAPPPIVNMRNPHQAQKQMLSM